MVGSVYRNNMRRTHSRLAAGLAGLILFVIPAASAPQRIVSTFLCTDEYVFRLAPRDRIAALSFEATDRHPVVSTIADAARGVRTIRPSAETVLALKPDLVVMYAGTMGELRAQLARAGVSVLDVPWANSLADIRRVATMLGERLGAPQKAKAMLAAMDLEIARAKAAAQRPPVATLIYEPNGYATSGDVTQEIMRVSGLRDAAPALGLTRLDTLPVETVIARAPELLILNGDPHAQTSRAALVQHHPALRALDGRATIAWAQLAPLLCPGPWSLETAETFTRLGARARALARRASRR